MGIFFNKCAVGFSQLQIENSIPNWLNLQTQNLHIQRANYTTYFIKGLEYLQIIVYVGDTWDQSPMDTEGQLYLLFPEYNSRLPIFSWITPATIPTALLTERPLVFMNLACDISKSPPLSFGLY